MKKETYASPNIDRIEISPIDVLDASIGENEIDMNKGDFFS